MHKYRFRGHNLTERRIGSIYVLLFNIKANS